MTELLLLFVKDHKNAGSPAVVTLIGFRLAQRPADKEHPFRHARCEYLFLPGAAVLILFDKILDKINVHIVIHYDPAVLNPLQ